MNPEISSDSSRPAEAGREALRRTYRETDLALSELYYRIQVNSEDPAQQFSPMFLPTAENMASARAEYDRLSAAVRDLPAPDPVFAVVKKHYLDFLDSLEYALNEAEQHPESLYLAFDSVLEAISRCNRQPDDERYAGVRKLLAERTAAADTALALIHARTAPADLPDLAASLRASAPAVLAEIPRIPSYFPGFSAGQVQGLQEDFRNYAGLLQRMADDLSPAPEKTPGPGSAEPDSAAQPEDLSRRMKMKPEEYRALLSRQLGVSLDDMLSWYQSEIEKTRAEVFRIARSLDIPEKPETMQDIADILFKYEPPCRSAEEMYARANQYLQRTRKVAHEYVRLPEDEICTCVPLPEYCRSSYPWGGYEGGDFRYRPFRGQMFLNQYNVRNISDGWIKLNSLHEAYPGHHVQYVRTATDIRPETVKIGTKLIPVLEGTTLRTEKAFEDTFAEDPFFPLFVAYRRHHGSVRIAVDLKMFYYGAPLSEVIDLYQRELGFDDVTARAQVQSHENTPGYFTCYYYGMKKLTSWEKEYGWSKKDFTELLFSVGYICIDRVEEILRLTPEERTRLFTEFGSLRKRN